MQHGDKKSGSGKDQSTQTLEQKEVARIKAALDAAQGVTGILPDLNAMVAEYAAAPPPEQKKFNDEFDAKLSSVGYSGFNTFCKKKAIEASQKYYSFSARHIVTAVLKETEIRIGEAKNEEQKIIIINQEKERILGGFLSHVWIDKKWMDHFGEIVLPHLGKYSKLHFCSRVCGDDQDVVYCAAFLLNQGLDKASLLFKMVEGAHPAGVDYLLQQGATTLALFHSPYDGGTRLPLDQALSLSDRHAHIRQTSLQNRRRCVKILLEHAFVFPDAQLSCPDRQIKYCQDHNEVPADVRALFDAYQSAKKNDEGFSSAWNECKEGSVKNKILSVLKAYEKGKIRKAVKLFPVAVPTNPGEKTKVAAEKLIKQLTSAKEDEVLSVLEKFSDTEEYKKTNPSSHFRGLLFWLETQIRKQKWPAPRKDLAPKPAGP